VQFFLIAPKHHLAALMVIALRKFAEYTNTTQVQGFHILIHKDFQVTHLQLEFLAMLLPVVFLEEAVC
jgi:hypothetical protein